MRPIKRTVMFRLCRYCGEELPRARRAFEICAKCNDSPLCDRCGHARGDHTRVFVHGQSRCSKRLGDFQTGVTWKCKCEGFRPLSGALSDATFASARPSSGEDPLGVPFRFAKPN